MNICNNCQPCNAIPRCITDLTIGTVANLNTKVNVYFKHQGNGRIIKIETTTDGSGLVKISGLDSTLFDPNQSYGIWVTVESSVDLENNLPITIDATEYECLITMFVEVHDDTSDPVSYPDISLNPKL